MRQLAFVFVMMGLVSCSTTKNRHAGCGNLKECLDLASDLTGASYIYVGKERDLSDALTTIGKVNWSQENANSLIGEVLAKSGFARVKAPNKNSYYIVTGRDIRYESNLVSYSATKDKNDELPPPNAADWIELVYKSENGPDVTSSISRNLRPFLSRYGRVIDDRYSSTIIVLENSSGIHRFLPLIRKMDVKLSKADMADMERHHKMMLYEERKRQETMMQLEEWRKKKEAEIKSANGVPTKKD